MMNKIFAAILAMVFLQGVAKAEVVVRGHYENRVRSVLVEEARIERRWVEKASEIHDGKVVVVDGHYEEVQVPARYEDRVYSVWVQDDVVYVAPPRVVIEFGSRLGWSGGYWRGDGRWRHGDRGHDRPRFQFGFQFRK